MVIDIASPALTLALAARHANPRHVGVSPMARGVSITRRTYRGPMPNQPEPEIIEAAAEIGVDPQDLRDFLDAGRHNPPRPDEPDDGPGITAELADLEPS